MGALLRVHLESELSYEVRVYCTRGIILLCVLTIVMVDAGKVLFFHQQQQYSVSGSKQ